MITILIIISIKPVLKITKSQNKMKGIEKIIFILI
jgi:hypothetical protein